MFEDRIIVNTIGKLIGAETDGVDVMMMNATRYAAKQFTSIFFFFSASWFSRYFLISAMAFSAPMDVAILAVAAERGRHDRIK